MTQVQTNQITFGKQTMKQLLSLVPTAKTKRKVGNDYIIKNAEGKTVATWQKQRLTNGLLVIW
jgi:hypothetical protein